MTDETTDDGRTGTDQTSTERAGTARASADRTETDRTSADRTDRSETGGLDRRRFVELAGAGSAFGLTALAGCTGGGGGSTETTSGEDTPTRTTASQDQIQEGGTLVWGHSEVTQGLDPHTTVTAASGRFLSSIYETLVGLTGDLELSPETSTARPGLASDWQVSDDGLNYTFTVREGVTFHDGSTLTSADVKYSFERIQEIPGTYASVFSAVNTISAPDDRTVEIQLSEVFQPFLRQLAFTGTAIVPEGATKEQLGSQPVGTGPFQFESRQQGNKARMSAFNDYWGQGPYLDAVEERTVTDPNTRLTGVQEGDFDFINDIPLDNFNDVVSGDQLKTRTWTPLSWAFLNMNNGRPPYDDQQFRKAMDFALDKQALVEGALFGNGRPTASPSFPNSPFRNEELEPRARDVERAQSLIKESSYAADEFDITFKVTTNYPWHVDAATIMQQQLQEVGLSIEIQKLQWGDWLSEVFANQNFRLAMVNFFTLWEPDYLYRNIWGSEGAFNFRNYSSQRYDDAVAAAESATSRKEAIQQFKKVQRILHDEVPDVLLWFRDGSLAAKQNVNGLPTVLDPNNSDLNFGQMWKSQ